MAMIHEKMCAIMAEMPSISKSQKNAQQGFKFRGIDDVMNALYPLLVKHSVYIRPDVQEIRMEDSTTKSGSVMHRAIVTVKYEFQTEDGSSVSCSCYGEGMDSGDKATSKAMAIAMKYAMFQTFCIPTEEMARTDPDRETPEEQVTVCTDCGKPIAPVTTASGRTIPANEIVERSVKAYGQALCYDCCAARKQK